MDNMEVNTPVIAAKPKRNWGWLLALGILFVILGVLGLGMTVAITLVSMYFFAVLLFVAGFSQLVDAWQARHWQGIIWHVLVAILYIIAGALISYDPMLASTLITAILAWVFIFMGISRLFLLFNLYRAPGWGWILFSSLAAIALGVLILIQWPMSGLWFLGMLIAIELLVSGWTYILLAVALRNKK